MDLDIHLDRRDTLCRTGHLEVHVAKEIFQPLDIGQQYKIIVRIACHQTAGNTRHHLFNRHARRHQGHTGRAGGSHGSGTVGLKGFRYGTDRVRELLLGGEYRQ